MHVALAAAALVLSACGSSPAGNAAGAPLPATPIPAAEDPGLVHVHGLGVNPSDGLVYAATHFGLWQVPEDGDARRVGDAGYDLMGFTVVGPDTFHASGHPTAADDLPPALGLIETTDGGQTWHSVALLGEVDFHVLRVAHDRVYGWSAGAFMVSEDGERWRQRGSAPILDFVVDPDDPEGVLASVTESFQDARLIRSSDEGRTWEDVEGPPIARLAWETPDRLWGLSVDGSVWRGSDGGNRWERVGDGVGFGPEAFLDAGDALYAAAGGAILVSGDGGLTWTIRHSQG